MRFFIVRHGETAWNIEGRFQGQIDTELNEKGLRQAELVAQRLSSKKFDAVISSPLKRALHTAHKITRLSGQDDVMIENALIEINHGDWEGCHADQIEKRWGQLLKKWHKTPEFVTMPGVGGESLNDIEKRSVGFINQIADTYNGDVLLVSHDAVIKVLLCYWTNSPISSFWRFQIPNCSISIVEMPHPNTLFPPRLILMGDVSHLGDSFTQSAQQRGL